MTKQIPWRRILIEGLVIVASILMAFGIDAWWDTRQEDLRRTVLMEDLEAEIALNVDGLRSTLERQRLRVARIEILLNELTPNAAGLPQDSLRSLQASILPNPSYDAAFGILNLLVQSGDLALLEDRTLRTRLAGIESLSEDYLSNQDWILQVQAQPEVLYGTGSIVLDYAAFVPGDLTITAASRDVRDAAAKYLTAVHTVTTLLLLGQGETLLAEFEGILELLSAP